MLKVMGQMQRRADLTLDAFRLHWRTIHRGLGLRLAHVGLLRGYVQNHRLDIPVDGLRTIADGIPELWFDDRNAFDALRRHEALRAGALQDEPNFMDTTRYRSLMLEAESLPLAPSRRECAGLLKVMVFLDADAPSAGDPSAFVLAAGEPVRLSTHRRAVFDAPPGEGDHVLVETSWWRSLAHFRAGWELRSWATPVDGLLVEERPVFWPGEVPPAAEWAPVQPSDSTRS